MTELVRAGAEFCRKTLKELREEMSGNEDGRMIYRGKQDTPLLDLVRAGFLRTIITPGSEQGVWATEEEAEEGEDAAGAGGSGEGGSGGGGLRTLKRKGESVASVPRRATTCHRVAVYRLDYDEEVMDDTMVIDAVISQSDIIRFLNHHQGALGAVMKRNLHDIGLGGEWDDEPTTGATDVSAPAPAPAAATTAAPGPPSAAFGVLGGSTTSPRSPSISVEPLAVYPQYIYARHPVCSIAQ